MLSAAPANLNCTNERPSSTSIRAFITAPSPMPPYSSGVCTPKNPAPFALSWRALSSSSFRPRSLRRSRFSTSGSSGMISLRTNVRTHSRISRSSSDRFRSMTSRLLVLCRLVLVLCRLVLVLRRLVLGELRAEFAFEYLVARPHWKSIHHLDATRVLMPAQPFLRPVPQLHGIHSARLGGDHHGAYLLAALLIRYANNGHLRHGRMPHQDLLDLARVDVETAPDDQVLLPVDNRDEPVGVLLPDVAAAEPAVDDHLRGRLRVVEITGEHVVARITISPSCPSGSSSIRSSRVSLAISTSTPQIAWPTVPALVPNQGWFTVAVGEVSDR